MDELYGGDILGPPLPHSGCLKADKYLEESQNPQITQPSAAPPSEAQFSVPDSWGSCTLSDPFPTQLPTGGLILSVSSL